MDLIGLVINVLRVCVIMSQALQAGKREEGIERESEGEKEEKKREREGEGVQFCVPMEREDVWK